MIDSFKSMHINSYYRTRVNTNGSWIGVNEVFKYNYYSHRNTKFSNTPFLTSFPVRFKSYSAEYRMSNYFRRSLTTIAHFYEKYYSHNKALSKISTHDSFRKTSINIKGER